MSKITAQELALLRTRPHYTKLWLSIYQPSTRLACRSNSASIAVGSTSIPFDGVTSGSYLSVRTGMTMYVGTTLGGKELGRIRVRSITSSTITVPSNSHILWADNLYLTIVDFYEIWPVFPKMVRSGEDVIFYKDVDIPYSNQNYVYGTLVNMGSHYAGFVGDSVYYTATGTTHVGGYGMTYDWAFEGGNPTGSTAHTPGFVAYNTPGHFTTRLTVNSTGTADNSYRHVSIYNRPGSGTSLPIQSWELSSLDGSRDEGGYSVEITVRQDMSSVKDGALVVLFADDVYGTTDQSIGGEQENRPSIVFVGYIKDGTIEYNYQTSSVTFEAVSITEMMKTRDGPAISLDSVSGTPATWYQLLDMDIRRAIYHYYRWHTTLLSLADIKILSKATTKIQYFETDPASMYDALNTLLSERLFLPQIANREGTIYLETQPEVINLPTGTVPVGMELLRQDWMEEPQIVETLVPPVAYVEMGGLGYSGAGTGTTGDFMASAPGTFANYLGEKTEGQYSLIVPSQAELNTLVGDFFAYQNAKYPDVSMQLSGNYRNIDIAPLNQYLITMNATDTYKGIVWNKKPFHVVDMGLVYDNRNNTLLPEVVFHELTDGYDGVTIDIPQTEINNYPGQPPYTPPEWSIVPLPVPGGISPIPPIIITQPPEIDPLCRDDLDFPSNGPFNLSLSSRNLTCVDDYPVVGYIDARLRDPLATNVTSYEVTGLWEKRATNTDPIGAWTPTTEDNWWEIYALSEAGAIIGTGVHDAVTGDGTVRTGTFNHVEAQNIKGFQVVVFSDTSKVLTMSDSSFDPYGKASTSYSWYYSSKTLIINQTIALAGASGGGWPEVTHSISFDSTDTGGQIFGGRWMNVIVNYSLSAPNYRSAYYDTDAGAEISVSPGNGISSNDYPPFYNPDLGSISAKLMSYLGVGSSFFVLNWRIVPLACHRLHLDSVKIYNLCGSGPIGT